MAQSHILAAVLGAVLINCLCGNGVKPEDAIARVGGTLITQQDVDLFSAIACLRLEAQDTFGLLAMDEMRGVVATEAVYQKARWSAAAAALRWSRKWQWKRRFYISRMFGTDILQKNCGFSDDSLRRFYDEYKEVFRTDGVIPPFDSIPLVVARKLFQTTCEPDTAIGISMDYSLPGNYRYFLTDGYPEYFMRKFYKEKYGVPLSKNCSELGGRRGVITDRDVRDAFFLLTPDEHARYRKDPVPFLCTLLRYKLFSERAAASGYLSRPAVKKTLEWLRKVEIAQRHVDKKIVPVVKKNVHMDSVMAFYSLCDEVGVQEAAADSVRQRHFSALVLQKMTLQYDSMIHLVCRAQGTEFMLEGWKDVMGGDPAVMRKKADSLRDAGNDREAQREYSILASNYGFTEEGRGALLEWASLDEARSMWLDAIKKYRRFLLYGEGKERRGEIMFKIGLLYDRYLSRPEMAEINYKWILKNAPESRWARDAEVMLQHLGEPMPGGEELRAEAARQGKEKTPR